MQSEGCHRTQWTQKPYSQPVVGEDMRPKLCVLSPEDHIEACSQDLISELIADHHQASCIFNLYYIVFISDEHLG